MSFQWPSFLWGLWLLPFGYLVFRSGRLPKALGVLLMMGGIGYLIDCVGNALAPGFSESTVGSLVSLPAGLGEIGTCLWLLIVEPIFRASELSIARDRLL